jgi:hypothetical protein
MNEKYFDDLMEESDSGAVLVGSALLEDTLSNLITNTAIKKWSV